MTDYEPCGWPGAKRTRAASSPLRVAMEKMEPGDTIRTRGSAAKNDTYAFARFMGRKGEYAQTVREGWVYIHRKVKGE